MLHPSPKDRLIVALDMPMEADARRLIARLGDQVSFYKVGLELLFAGGLDLAQDLEASRQTRLPRHEAAQDMGNTSTAGTNAAELGLPFPHHPPHRSEDDESAVAGRGKARLKLLAVTVLTNLTDDDLRQQGTKMSAADLVLHRARLAKEAGCDGVIASGQERNAYARP